MGAVVPASLDEAGSEAGTTAREVRSTWGLSSGGGGGRCLGKNRRGTPWTMSRGGLSSHFLIRLAQQKGQTQAS
jgi:hypothetical protein